MRDIMQQRLNSLRMALEGAGLDGIILNQHVYVFHLVDWLPPYWASVFLVVGVKDLILVSPFVPEGVTPFWTDAMIYESFALEKQVAATENAVTALREALVRAELSGRQVGAALEALPGAYAMPLGEKSSIRDATGLMYKVTAVKDEVAQKAIRERVGFLDRAFETAAQVIRPGVRETEVLGAIYASLAQSLGAPLTLHCNFASGKRTLEDEPEPTNKHIEKGEVVMIDLYPQLGAYAADYTRNFIVGEPTAGQQEQHAVLENALHVAERALRPGLKASELDRIVRNVIKEEGYGPYAYQHHTGHAFGLMIPEPPWLIPADHTALKAGMVIAVEPGIYQPQHGGMRLEGNYLITEDGCESLVGYPPTLTVCEG